MSIPSNLRPRDQRVWRSILVAIVASAYLAADALILVMATLLRPLADDYCEGFIARLGLFGSIAHWWNSWTGDLLLSAVWYPLVGLPLVAFPWDFTSAIAFVSSIACVSLSLALLAIYAGFSGQVAFINYWKYVLFLIVVGSGTYVLYWWVPATLGIERTKYLSLAVATTSWQTVNSSYVVAPLILAISALSIGLSRIRTRWCLVLLMCVGVLAGLGGVWVAATTFVVILMSGLSLVLYRSDRIRQWGLFASAVLASTTVGFAIALQSPGVHARLRITSSDKLEAGLSLSQVTSSLTQGTRMWMSLTLGLGALFVFAAFLVTGIAAGSSRLIPPILRQVPVLWVGATFLVGGLVLSLVFAAAEEFGYRAFWHYVPVGVVAFLGWALLGLGLGSAANTLNFRWLKGMTWILLAATLLVGASTTIHMYRAISDRHDAWNLGPAPFAAVGDLDQAWVESCWRDLASLRDAPPRSG